MQDFIRKSSKQDIKEDYIIGNIIGEGAYGNVRLCVHKQTGTARAVKVIFKKYLEDIEGTERDIVDEIYVLRTVCLLYTSPSPRDATLSRMPSSA